MDKRPLRPELTETHLSINDIVDASWDKVESAGGLLKWQSGLAETADDKRYSDPWYRHWYYISKPVLQWLPPAVVGVLLLVGQIWFPEMATKLGWHLGENMGYIRMAMFLIGAFAIFAAWPRFVPEDWKPEDDEELERAHEHFARLGSRFTRKD